MDDSGAAFARDTLVFRTMGMPEGGGEALPIVAMLVEVAKAAHYAMDDCGDLVLTEEGAARLSNALDALDELPELDDGYVRDGWCKAKDHLAIALDAKVREQLAKRYEQEGFHGIAANLRGTQEAATPPAPQRLAQGEVNAITFYRCLKCDHYYRVRVTECDCEPGARTFEPITMIPQPPHHDRGEELHTAICQAVALLNMEPMTTAGLLQAHDILRKAIS